MCAPNVDETISPRRGGLCISHALCIVCAAGLRVPHPPVHIEHVPASYKDFTSWTHCTFQPNTDWTSPKPSRNQVQLQVLRAPQLFPPFRTTSHHINRHDHQTWQTDTWILPPPPEASCRRGADAATRPCHQPDRHDAGHHGPESVLLQCQTDD